MNNKKNIILEEYENEFSYKKSKTNLDIQFGDSNLAGLTRD